MSEVKLEKVTFEFTQEEHCASTDMGGIELLTVECTSDLGISNTDGAFFVLKTEQWAINDIDELKLLFDKIEQAINLVK
jgi:hypothetical protein